MTNTVVFTFKLNRGAEKRRQEAIILWRGRERVRNERRHRERERHTHTKKEIENAISFPFHIYMLPPLLTYMNSIWQSCLCTLLWKESSSGKTHPSSLKLPLPPSLLLQMQQKWWTHPLQVEEEVCVYLVTGQPCLPLLNPWPLLMACCPPLAPERWSGCESLESL